MSHLPIPEPDPLGPGYTPKVDDEPEDDKKDHEHNLDEREDELDLAKDANKRKPDSRGQHDKDHNPDGGTNILDGVEPVREQNANGRDLGGDAQDVAVDQVPAYREAQGRVDEELGVAHKGARDGQQGRRLAQGELHRAHDEPDGRVGQQGPQRARALHGAAQAQEQARADGARDAQHGQVALLEAAAQVLVLGRRDEVAVMVGGGGGGGGTAGRRGEEAALAAVLGGVEVRDGGHAESAVDGFGRRGRRRRRRRRERHGERRLWIVAARQTLSFLLAASRPRGLRGRQESCEWST